MEEHFVCKVKGCEQAKSGKVFTLSRSFVSHYRLAHHNVDEGRRQVVLQRRQALAKQKVEQALAESGDFMQARDAAEDLAPTDKTVGITPLGEAVIDQIDHLIASEDTAGFLDKRIERLRAELEVVRARMVEAETSMHSLESELARTEAAKAAFESVYSHGRPPGDR